MTRRARKEEEGGRELPFRPPRCQARSEPCFVCLPGVLSRRDAWPLGVAAMEPHSPGVVGSPARRCVQTSEHPAGPSGAPRFHAVVLICRPPSRMELGFTSPWSRSPPESSRPAGRPTLSGRRRLPRGSPPLRRHPPGQPHVQRRVHRPLRFRSQVFTTSQRFPGKPGLRGLVSCRSRPWGSPFRALLLAGVACASRRRFAPMQFSTGRQIPRARAWPFHSGFHRRPRLATWWPGSPPELGHRFHRACAYARIGFPGALTLPAHLGVATFRLRLLRSLDPPAKPYLVRSPKRPSAAVALLGFAPPEPSSDRASGPLTLRTVPSTAR